MGDNTLGAFLRLARPHFLPPGLILYTLGTLLATVQGFYFDISKFLLGYLIFFFAHVATHLSNDYFDRAGDSFAEQTGLSGGSGILVSRPELAPLTLRVAIGLMAMSIGTAVVFTIVFSCPLWFLFFAIGAALLAWFYTAPPIKLAYRGLSEASTAVAVGFIMPATGYFAMAGTIDAWFAVLCLPFVLYGLLFIISVEMPDMEADRIAKKLTLIVKRGIGIGYSLPLVAGALSTVLFISFALSGVLGSRVNFWAIGAISLIPLAICAIGMVKKPEGRELMIRQVRLNFTGLLLFFIFFEILLASTVLLA